MSETDGNGYGVERARVAALISVEEAQYRLDTSKTLSDIRADVANMKGWVQGAVTAISFAIAALSVITVLK
jgi:hypothetical protein